MDIDDMLTQIDEKLNNASNIECPYRSRVIPFCQGIRFNCDVDSGYVDYIHSVNGVRNECTESPIKEIYITDIDSCCSRFIEGNYRPDSNFGVLSLPNAPTAIVSVGGWDTPSERPTFEVGENGVVAVWQRQVYDRCNKSGRRRKNLLTLEDAGSFASFIGQLSERGAERLVVHCGSGISRSSAAAAAASKALWGDDLWAFARPYAWGPNIDVYTKLLHGLGFLDDLEETDCVPRARHRFAEWCFRGDDWVLESYNADYIDLHFYHKTLHDASDYQYHSHRMYTFVPENNPLIGTRDWGLLQALQKPFLK